MKYAPPGGTDAQTNNKPALKEALLYRLRTELQQLQEIFNQVTKGQVRLDACNSYIQKTRKDIMELISALEVEEKNSSSYADNYRRIINYWEQMKDSPLLLCSEDETGKTLDEDAQGLTHALTIFNAQMKEIIFEIGFLTIPNRLDRWLKATKPGHYVPFHDVFENEMPDHADRVKLLNLISWSPKRLRDNGGMVELDTGLVYCYETDPVIRRNGFRLLIEVFILFTVIIAGMAYVPLGGWPLAPENLAALLFGWAALVIGVVVHLAIDTTKQQQKSTRPLSIVLNDLPLLINIKYGQIMLKIFLCLVGFTGLVFAAGIENAKPLNAFFVGYSLDSFIGVLSAGIEQKAAAQLTTLKQKLGIAEKG